MADTDKKFLDDDGVSQFAEETKKYVDNKVSQLDDVYIRNDDTTVVRLRNQNEINLQEDHNNAWFGYRDGKVNNWKFGDGTEGGLADVYVKDLYLGDEKLSETYIRRDDTTIVKLVNDNEINLQEDHTNAWFGYRDGKVTNWKFGDGTEGGLADVYVKDLYLGDQKLSDLLGDKANDDDVVHKTGDEAISGLKTFINPITITRPNIGTTGYVVKLTFKRGDAIASVNHSTFRVTDSENNIVSDVCTENYTDGKVAQILNVRNTNAAGAQVQSSISHLLDKTGDQDWFYSVRDGKTYLGTSAYRWADVNTVLLNGKVPAYDADVVHKTGNEIISGDKTFNSLITKSTNLERGSIPATDIREDPIFISVDKNNRRTLAFYNYYFTSGYGRTVLYAYNHNTTDYDNIGLAFSFYNSGTSSKAIHPYTSDAYDLGTVANKWKDVNTVLLNGKTPAYDADVVHKTGNETVAGVKTFTSSTVIDGSGKFYQAYATDYIKGGVPSSAMYQGIRFYDDQKNSTVANHITGAFEIMYNVDGYNKTYIGCRNYSDTTQLNYNVGLRVPNDATKSIDFFPSIDNKINLGTANYKWADTNTVLLNGKVPAYDADVVHKTGDETVNGTKTFTLAPVSSNGATTNGFFIKTTAVARNEVPTVIYHSTFRVLDKNSQILGEYCVEKSNSGSSLLNMNVRTEKDDGTQIVKGLYLNLKNDGSDISFHPSSTDEFNLGTSYAKWKDIYTNSVNGKTPDLIEEQGDGYIRYANGIQICWANVLLHNLAQGAGYSYACNFPKSFVAAPSVTVNYSSAYSTDTGIAAESIGTAGCTIWVKNTKLSVDDFNINYMAIGRWK